MAKERATDLEYLKWFYQNVDLGPGESDYKDSLKERFIKSTGKNIPEGYNYYSDGETKTDQ